MAETKTVEYGLKINNADDARKAVEDLKNGADEAGKSFKSLDQIIEEGSKQLAILSAAGKKNTKEFEELAKVIGELQKNVDVANSAIDKYAENTDNKINESINVFETGTSVIGLFSSALVALDSDENKLSETTEKLIAIQTTLNSLQSIQESLMNKSSGTYRTLHKLKTLIIGDTNKEIVATSKLGKVFNIANGATKGLTTGMKLLRGAIIGTGIGLLVVAVGELIANWDTLKNKIFDSIPGLKTVGEWFSSISGSISNFFGGSVKSSEDVTNNIESIVSLVDKYNSTLSKHIKLASDAYDQNKRILENEKASYEERKKAAKDYYDNVSGFINEFALNLKELIVLNKNALESIPKAKDGTKDYKAVKEDIIDLLNTLKVGDVTIFSFPEKINESLIDILNSGEEYFKEHKDIAKQFTDEEISQYTKLSNTYKLLKDKEKNYILEYIELVKTREELANSYISIEKKSTDFKLDYLEEIKSLEDKETKDAKERADKAKKLEDDRKKELKKSYDFEKQLIDLNVKDYEEAWNKKFRILKEEYKEQLISEQEFQIEYAKLVKDREKVFEEREKRILELSSQIKDIEYSIALTESEQIARVYETTAENALSYQKARYHYAKEYKEKEKRINDEYLHNYEKLESAYLKDVSDLSKTEEEKNLIKEKFVKEEILLEKKREEDLVAITKDLNKKLEDLDTQRRERILSLTEQTLSTAASITSSIFELIDANIQRTMDKISESITSIEEQLGRVDRNINRHINRLTGYYEALSDSTGEEKQDLLAYIKDQEDALNHQYNLEQQLEKKKYEKEKELKREENRQKKVQLQNQLIQAIITGATATLNGFATQPFLPVGVAMGALASTLSAIQIGVISSNIGKIKYAEGGMLNGPSHSNGGIPVGNTGIEVEGGEYVVNKKATKRFLPILEQINDYGRSTRKFANGGQMNLITESDKTSTLLDNINFSPVVSVVDINRENNRLSKVRVLSQI